MFSRLFLVAGLMGVWSCSDDEKPGAHLGGAGANPGGADSDSAGSAGRSQAGGSGSADAGQAGGSAAGHGSSSGGGATMGGAGEAASGSGSVGGGGTLAGAGGTGLGGTAAGDGGASSDENPYRACADENDESCPVAGSMCHADYGCEPPCPTGTVSCPAPLGGGTATTYCQQRFCRLDCGFGKTCPTGMTCDTTTVFCIANGQ